MHFSFHFPALPKVGMRIFKTLGAVLLVCAAYGLLGGRNPCFACIGAVFGLGSFWREGVRHGGNRFLGTLLGGLVVIPFYWLYANRPFGLPGHLYLVLGLFCVIYINLLFGAHSAIQPAAVVYFVVMFTVTKDRYVSYTIARILDTGVGVLASLWPSTACSPPPATPGTRRMQRPCGRMRPPMPGALKKRTRRAGAGAAFPEKGAQVIDICHL